MERRLAAVLIADAVGYGRLSQVDEEGTRTLFQATLKEVFEPEIAAHGGRLVKTMGDGLLVEFPSVVNALRCAVGIQRAVTKRNMGVPPDRRLEFRIALNLGDVIVEGEDIHGNGVNIADRLQALAAPGGVLISGTAYDHAINNLDVNYEFLGEHRLKNIAEPVRVYAVSTDPRPTTTIAMRPGPPARRRWQWAAAAMAIVMLFAAGTAAWLWPWAPDTTTPGSSAPADGRPSLAVLPFDNLSDDKQQGYLADGMTEDLTTELARMPGLFVVSRNAAFSFKDAKLQPAEIASRLGVRYILEGSVRRTGDDMRINAQLIDTSTGGHLWAERFDGAWADVFQVQDKIVADIAEALKLRLVTGQRASQVAGGTSDPAAYEVFLKGLELEYRGTPDDVAKAAALYRQAVALDPNFGRAWAEIAWVYWNIHGREQREALGVPWDGIMDKVQEYLQEAQKNPSPTYYQILADLLIRQQKSDEAIAALEKAIALDSSDPGNYEQMSAALTFNGRPAEGRGYVDAALRLDPDWTDWRHYLAAQAYFSMDRFEDAAASLEKIDPKSGAYWARFYGLILQMSTYGHLGRSADAHASQEALTPLLYGDELSGLLAQTFLVFKNYTDTERLLVGLRKADVPDLPYGYDPASKDRLSHEEMTTLIFGHTVNYRNIGAEPGMTASTTFTREGAATLSRPDGVVAGSYMQGVDPRHEDRTICFWWEKFIVECVAIFRNATGTAAEENEFLWINQGNPWSFSVVK